MITLISAETPMTRHDLEFLADMLGTVEQRTIGGPPDMRHPARYGYIPTEQLAEAIAEGMRDPVANRRADLRISRLLAFCGQIERAASVSPMGGVAPLTPKEAPRLHAIDEYRGRVPRFLALPSAGARVGRRDN